MNRMKKQQQIEELIQQAFSPVHMELVNESYMHSVPPGSESHFKLVVAAEAFEGLRAVQRHQAVYRAMGTLMESIHALALHTYTPGEWSEKVAAPDSPNCLGGSKSA